ncbi:MAG: class I SAM-dependent methyltransferase [Pseudomonadota bacterium]|nr:class I SAM-dependent methyltransferase [Pseudomonadota bacterium]
MGADYDRIGINYSDLRKPDPRIAATISAALGQAGTVLSVGAGTGSYEPSDRQVTALEPSLEMIRQRPSGAARVVQGAAEDLPFADESFDASMAILTVHHWADKAKGLAEMRRVTRGPIVLLTFDPAHRDAWLNDYFPELVILDEAQIPRIIDYESWLGPVQVSTVPVPHDCTDGFLYAYWRRPTAYLDERVRSGISSFWKIDNVEQGLRKLAGDLESGAWRRHYSDLLALDAYDAGYRLVTTR